MVDLCTITFTARIILPRVPLPLGLLSRLCFADLNSSLSKDTEPKQYDHNADHEFHNQEQNQCAKDAINKQLRGRKTEREERKQGKKGRR